MSPLNIYEQIILEDVDVRGISNLKEFDIRLKYIKSYSPSLFIKFLRAWIKVLTALSGTAFAGGILAVITGIVNFVITGDGHVGDSKIKWLEVAFGGVVALFVGLLIFAVRVTSKDWMINTVINELTELVYSGRIQTLEDQQELEKLIGDLKILELKESGTNALAISQCINGLSHGTARNMIK